MKIFNFYATAASLLGMPSVHSHTLNEERQLRRPPTPRRTVSDQYYRPSEEVPHEGTWLQWPHNSGWDPHHILRYEAIWIQMTEALHTGERVHIIVYNWRQLKRVKRKLQNRGLNMSQVDFWDYPTDDVWVRDNGPIFVYDSSGNLAVEDWSFNGWGNKADWWFDDYIPTDVSRDLRLPRVDVDMTNEGGSIEVDGKGTLMAKKSSILNENRNPGMTQEEAEGYFRCYLGVTNFIWLDGEKGFDITDDHIDGTARFASNNTIVTVKRDDFWNPAEYDVLASAVNAEGRAYTLVHLPITQNNVAGTGDKGVYVNYYVGNDVVIVPTFNDPKDAEAILILEGVYSNRRVVGINMVELWVDGGGAHCVTQQQPVTSRR